MMHMFLLFVCLLFCSFTLSPVCIYVAGQSTPSIILRGFEDGVSHRTYVSCGWNVTAALSRSSTPFMYQLGGEVYGSSTVWNSSIDVSTSGSWSNMLYTTIQYPVFNWNYAASGYYTYSPLGRYAAASAMNRAGNILLWGGKVHTLTPRMTTTTTHPHTHSYTHRDTCDAQA